MDNKHLAHKKTYRKQQRRTYVVRILVLPRYVLGGITLVLSMITWYALGKFIKGSNDKLSIQRELYKPVKKEMKLDKKQFKKENKESYNNIEEVDTNVQTN